MKLIWTKDNEYFAHALLDPEDGSGYHMMRLQQGKLFYAYHRWPKHLRRSTDGRVLEITALYTGPDKIAAAAACNEHYQKSLEQTA